jgi:hypothetical protein
VADFLTSLVETAERLTDFPLKLLVADPINSVRHSGSDLHDMRRRFVEALDRIKALRVNLVLVGEDDEHGQSDELDFLEKICDTAIRLSIESSNLYSRKFFEIRKSRLQREQRGAHPYSIVSGEGYVIQPSTAAVASRIRNRRTSPKDTSNRFGIAGIDSILGRTALASGDVIVLSGSQGCWRREIGMAFLLSKEGDPRQVRSERHRVPLFLSFGRSVESLQAMLSEDHVWYLSRGKGAKRPDEVRVLGVLPGYTNPGSVFQRLEEKLDDIRRAGLSLDRVLVDGISSLEGMFPLLSSDVAFPGTLVEFFRRQRVTAAYVIGSEPRSRPASVESVITESADVLITLRRPNARNSSVEGQVTKAHGAGYKRDWFGVDFVPGRGFIVDMRQ